MTRGRGEKIDITDGNKLLIKNEKRTGTRGKKRSRKVIGQGEK